jgi:hypothetical protein
MIGPAGEDKVGIKGRIKHKKGIKGKATVPNAHPKCWECIILYKKDKKSCAFSSYLHLQIFQMDNVLA